MANENNADNKKWFRVGSILKKKEGPGSYIKVSNDITLKEGMILNVFDPRKRPGITEEQLAKIPDFVKADILLAPARTSTSTV